VDYFRTYYAPNNCILVLVGDFDTKTAVAQITQAFGSIPSQTPPAKPVNSEPGQVGERRVEVHHPAEAVTFQIGYKAPSVTDQDIYALELIASLLGDGESSRLHQALVVERQIALSAGTFFRNRLDPTLFELTVELKPGRQAEQGIRAVDSVLAALAADGPAARELEKAKNVREAAFVKSLKTNYGVGETIGYYEHVFGDFNAMFRTIDSYRAVTAADVKRVAKQTFDRRRRTIAVLVPETEPGSGGPAQ
jgi:predicted Zn-dependent peptidase